MKTPALLLTVALLFPACTADSPQDADPPDEPFRLEVLADDFSFALEDRVPAGLVEMRLENTGAEPHQALVYRLNEGVAYKDYLEAVLEDDSQFPALSTRVGGVNYGISAGDSETHAETDPYEPGTYALVCFIKETESGKNHYELGMISPFTVE